MGDSAALQAPAWTAADLVEHFGPILLTRIRLDPPPGMATEQDVIDIHDHEDRLYELIDGVLVEKAMGFYEAYLALSLGSILGGFVQQHRLGIVVGADGMIRLSPGLVRIPDVSFVSFDRLPNRQIPREPIADLVPDLAIEVLSKSNTKKEMDRKLRDYFKAGVRLVWYVQPDDHTVEVFTSPRARLVLRENQALDGGDVLPGFTLPLPQLFAEPGQA